jgi:hypothetical protein
MSNESGIDFNLPILDINDEPMKQKKTIDGEEYTVTLGEVCVNSLMALLEGDKSDGVEKLKKYNLARKIKGGDGDDFSIIELNSTRKKLVEEQVDKIYGALVYSRVYEALEGNTKSEDD